MNKILSLVFVLIFLSSAVLAQDRGAKPTPTPPEDQDVVKISTTLIQLDVTVTDASGKPIPDLKPSEIEIYENGRKRRITNFSFISSDPVSHQRARPENAITPPPALPPSPLSVGGVRRTTAVVVDDISMSWESVSYTRRALKKFIDEQIQDGDLVAILRTGAGIGALQQFTTDKRVLHSAVDRIKYNMMGTGGITAHEPLTPSGAQTLSQGMGVLSPSFEEEVEAFLAMARSKRQAIFAAGTLGTLQQIVSGMAPMPGRKSVILFSDGFELFERDRTGRKQSGPVVQHVRKLIDQANRASVVFYPIDPRGLQPGLMQAADNTWGMNAQSIRLAMESRRRQIIESRDGPDFLARETGGFVTANNNDLNRALGAALNDQSYYLVGYDPDSDTFDAAASRYNKIEIKVLRKGAKVRFRSGFYGVTDSTRIQGPPPDPTKNYIAQLTEAIMSPFAANGITLRLNSIFGSTGTDGLYVRSLLHINGGDLTFREEPDGKMTCSFDVLATSFGAGGILVDQIGKTYTVSVTPEVYQKALKEGIVYHFKFPVKKPGPYQYRAAIRDAISGRIGAANQFVQVPDIASGAFTTSSIVLEDMTVEEFQTWSGAGSVGATDPMRDTALRQIKVGRVYRYSYEIYNAQLDERKQPHLETVTRVYRDGKLIMTGPAKPFDATGQTDLARLRSFGGLAIGSEMEPGEYVLQIIVVDKAKKAANRYATEFVQFEVVSVR